MRYWYKAPLDHQQAVEISRHLSQQQPARRSWQVFEYLVLPALPVLAGLLIYRRRQRYTRPRHTVLP